REGVGNVDRLVRAGGAEVAGVGSQRVPLRAGVRAPDQDPAPVVTVFGLELGLEGQLVPVRPGEIDGGRRRVRRQNLYPVVVIAVAVRESGLAHPPRGPNAGMGAAGDGVPRSRLTLAEVDEAPTGGAPLQVGEVDLMADGGLGDGGRTAAGGVGVRGFD